MYTILFSIDSLYNPTISLKVIKSKGKRRNSYDLFEIVFTG